jgi:hypothetical protein
MSAVARTSRNQPKQEDLDQESRIMPITLMSSFLLIIPFHSSLFACWIAESPTHIIHFNGERFLGPYE